MHKIRISALLQTYWFSDVAYARLCSLDKNGWHYSEARRLADFILDDDGTLIKCRYSLEDLIDNFYKTKEGVSNV